MGNHLIDGEFQSDKYPTTPRGKVPLSVRDPTAQDLLWEYARRRRAVDAEFSDDLEAALRAAGSSPRLRYVLFAGSSPSASFIGCTIPEIEYDPDAASDHPSASSEYVDGYTDARSIAMPSLDLASKRLSDAYLFLDAIGRAAGMTMFPSGSESKPDHAAVTVIAASIASICAWVTDANGRVTNLPEIASSIEQWVKRSESLRTDPDPGSHRPSKKRTRPGKIRQAKKKSSKPRRSS